MINADLSILSVKQYINNIILIEWKKCLVEMRDVYLQLIATKTGTITVFDLTLVFQEFEWMKNKNG